MFAAFCTVVAMAAAGLAFVASLASPDVGGAMGLGFGLVAVVSALLAVAWRPHPKPPADHPRTENHSKNPS